MIISYFLLYLHSCWPYYIVYWEEKTKKQKKKPRNNQNIKLSHHIFFPICMRTFFPFIEDELSELLAKASPMYLYTRSHLLSSTQGHCFSYSLLFGILNFSFRFFLSARRHISQIVILLFYILQCVPIIPLRIRANIL